MSDYVLFNLLNALGKRDKMRGLYATFYGRQNVFKICKPLVIYRFYCMVSFHSQTRRYMIKELKIDVTSM